MCKIKCRLFITMVISSAVGWGAGCGSTSQTAQPAATNTASTASTGAQTNALTLTATTLSVAQDGTDQLSASGGTAPYFYYIINSAGNPVNTGTEGTLGKPAAYIKHPQRR